MNASLNRFRGRRIGRPFAAALTVALTAGLAGFSLTHSAHRGIAEKNVTLPDRPDGNGTGTRLPNGWHVTPAGTPISAAGRPAAQDGCSARTGRLPAGR